MKLKLVIVFSLLVIGITNAGMNERFDSLIVAGIDQIYNIKLDKAEKTFTKVIKEYPQHPSGYFFDAMILWWQILMDPENEDYDDALIDKLDFVIDFCDEILERNPYNVDAMFFKGGSLGFRGRLYAFRQSWFYAALDGKDALPLVYNAYKAAPANPDIQLGFGIYNYYAAVIPEKYPVVKPFMALFPEGDKQKGLEQIKYVAESGKYAKIESMYFLATSYYGFENDFDKAYEYTDKLTSMFPDNPKFQSLKGRIWIKLNKNSEAAGIFQNIYRRCERNMPGYNNSAKREASYYVAAQYERLGILDSAKHYFEVCESVSKLMDEDEESGFLVNAAIYLAKIDTRLGNKKEAIRRYKEVLDYRDYRNSRDKAEEALEKLYKNN
jgi:tetratricopeptide (TPR) repeat protein